MSKTRKQPMPKETDWYQMTNSDVLKEFMADEIFPEESLDSEFIPRLWATRKVGYLLDQIRLNGESQELVDEIIALSKRYGIITPYTSFLILEDEPPGPMFDDSFKAESGEGAIDASNAVRDYKSSDNVEGVRSGGVKYVGNKTFFMRDDFWRDSEYIEDEPTVIRVNKYHELGINPLGNNLFLEYDNKPGVIGIVATTLGSNSINIESIVARKDTGKGKKQLLTIRTEQAMTAGLLNKIVRKVESRSVKVYSANNIQFT